MRPLDSRGGESGVRRELQGLRAQLHRHQVYLGVALAVLGMGTFAAVALVGFQGLRLAETQSQLRALDESTRRAASELERGLARQGEELAAIRKAATDELKAMRDAHRRLAEARDPAQELTALREANAALWTELANQRAELLDALTERDDTAEPGTPPSSGPVSRFRLGETRFVDPDEDPEAIKGFVKGNEKVYRATALPANPALLLLELRPEKVGLGEPYDLFVRLVNRSHRSLDFTALRIDWSFNGRNTGGAVPLVVDRVAAQGSELICVVSGEWTEAHENGPSSVTATVTVDGGARLSNKLEW